MRTLVMSDEVMPIVYSLQISERFRGVELALGCGDLPFSYLEFVVTMLAIPCLYVRGNHDGPEHTSGGTTIEEARGCECLEGRSMLHQGLLFAGLGGSLRYNQRSGDQYTEHEMRLRAWRLVPRLLFNRLCYGRYLDVLLTHAPPLGIHNGPDLAHRGFRTFLWLMDWFEPRYLLHGHIHHAYRFSPHTETCYRKTLVINVSGYRVLDLPSCGRRTV